MEQRGYVVQSENAEDDEIEDDIDYYFEENGTLYLKYNIAYHLNDLSRDDENIILKKLDKVAEAYGQTDKTMVVKYIADSFGNEFKVMTFNK